MYAELRNIYSSLLFCTAVYFIKTGNVSLITSGFKQTSFFFVKLCLKQSETCFEHFQEKRLKHQQNSTFLVNEGLSGNQVRETMTQEQDCVDNSKIDGKWLPVPI